MNHFTDRVSVARRGRAGLLVVVIMGMLVAGLLGAAPSPAATPAPHWLIASTSGPTYFKPGTAGEYTVFVVNDGSVSADGSAVTVADTLPEGVTATEISGSNRDVAPPLQCTLATVSCTDPANEKIASGDLLVIKIRVSVGTILPSSLTNSVTVSGGGAPSLSASTMTPISSSPLQFGVSYWTTNITDMSGDADTQVGSHPFEITTVLAFNIGSLNAAVKDIDVALPPGLVGDPNAVPRCSQAVFQTVNLIYNCPTDTQVGTVRLFFYGEGTAEQDRPVYNVEPPPGQPAELGFSVTGSTHIPMFFHVHSKPDYGVTAQLSKIIEIDPVRASILTLWGVPADPSHDARREGPECLNGCASNVISKPFLTLPTSCQGEATGLSIASDSWQEPGLLSEDGSPNLSGPNWVTSIAGLPAFTGCGHLSFVPTIAVAPGTTQAGTPSGYTVDLRVPQNDDPSGLATPHLKKAVVTLPAGTVISPSAADGLEGCSDGQFALHSTALAGCPAASQVGRLKITTPLLSEPLEGQVFVGTPSCGPCSPRDAREGRLVRVFLQAHGSGVTVKLAGSVSVNPATGQLTTTFDDNPQLPFSELELVLNGGSRAPLVNPSVCGAATTTSDLTPWSSPFTADAIASSHFIVTGCAAQPFSPAFAAGTISSWAGAFGSFTTTFSRQDSEQDFSAVQITTPPGLLGMLSSVTLCGEPQAALGQCSPASEIGHATVAAGAGDSPIYLPVAGQPANPVYLTTGYHGAPFGLDVVVPAVAGPFNLGTVVVRARVDVDPHTSRVTITSDPLPAILDGVPLHVRMVNVTVDRPGFIFNPTDCDVLRVAGTIASTEGVAAAVSSPFEAVNCANLRFAPRFTMSTAGRASKTDGTSLDVRVAAKGGPRPSGGEANIASVKVDLPKQLPSRLTTLQKACLASVFAANPASCPKESDVGSATASTPVLAHPLRGPAYLVSHGGAGFPDLEIVLQGEGIVLILDGSTDVKKGVTSSTFRSVPDVPIISFELRLPAGRYSVLGTNLPAKAKHSLCGQSLVAPTAITGQNGAVLRQNTRIAVTGCPRARRAVRGKS